MAEVRHRSDEGGASSPFTRRTGPGAGETTHAFSNSAAPRVDYVAGRAERNRVARPRLLEPEILSKSDYCENGGAVQLGGKVKSVGVELAACKTLASAIFTFLDLSAAPRAYLNSVTKLTLYNQNLRENKWWSRRPLAASETTLALALESSESSLK